MIDGKPLRSVHVLQQAVINAESDEASGRKSEHGFDWTGPYCGGHRQEMIVKETISIAFTYQKCAKREIMVIRFLKQARGGRKKPCYIGEHPIVAWLEEIGRLRYQALERTLIFQCAVSNRYAERHVAAFCRHIKNAEQVYQIWICRFIVNDEASVDRNFLSVIIDIYRVAMPAESVIRLINSNRIA